MSAPERVWPLGSYAPGGYMCKCLDCKKTFEGDKRALSCLECAVKSAKSRHEALATRLAEVEREAAYWKTCSSAQGTLIASGVFVTNEDYIALSSALAENERLKAALKPFADEAEAYDPPDGDDKHVAWASDFPIGSLRAARTALNGGTPND